MKHPNNMTDHERNLTVAELIYPDANVFASECANYILVTTQLDCGCIYEEGGFNYCNNWGDLMPLCLEHNVEYDRQADGTYLIDAYVRDADCFTISAVGKKELQIALVNCLILVLREKGKNDD